MTPATPKALDAVRRMMGYPATTIFVWGLVDTPAPFQEVMAANGLTATPSTWAFGPGGALELRVTTKHLRQAQEDLYMDLVRVRSCGTFGVAMVCDLPTYEPATELSIACSTWPQDISLWSHKDHTERLFPGPVGLLERFGTEPFTLATSAHQVLEHRARWPVPESPVAL